MDLPLLPTSLWSYLSSGTIQSIWEESAGVGGLRPDQHPCFPQLYLDGKAYSEASQPKLGCCLRGQELPSHTAVGDPGPPSLAPHHPAHHGLDRGLTGALHTPYRAPKG